MNGIPLKLRFFIVAMLTSFLVTAQSNQRFKVVLDPGHGGKDSGTHHDKFLEKDIVLAVSTEVGNLLKSEKDIEVIYTRKTDVFVAVKERSVIANDAQGNVFVSIHCNGVNSTAASGTETFVMGLSKNKSNLDVAKKENSVIMLEDDYKTKYAGFDPNSPESIIGLTLLQEDYVHQSIDLASKIQDGFTYDLKRKNRGVKQGPFWVLHGAFMPSVLIELGFVSNKEEGTYLNSKKGQKELAGAIAKAIVDYKNAYFKGGTTASSTSNTTKSTVTTTKKDVEQSSKSTTTSSKGITYKVQIAASSKVLALKPQNFKGLSGVTMEKGSKINKYFYLETSDYKQAEKNLKTAKDKGHTSSFIVAYKNGKQIALKDALK